MIELLMLAKHWSPGQVKTRLARKLGDRASASLQRIFLETLLTRFADRADRRTVLYTPAEQAAAFANLIAGRAWQLRVQGPGDLGQRMAAAAEDSLRTHRAVLLLGADSPTLPCELMDEAIRRLDDSEIVIGPTADGGYYLLGLRQFYPELFERIPWSTAAVFETTLQRIREIGPHVRATVLPPWYDVDESTDLERLRQELSQDLARQPEYQRLREWFRQAFT